MATEKKSKFMEWYGSYSGKHTVNIVYSAGASVVIVGALFKIMHWPGAGIILTAGMCTEAFLFLIGVLEAPHEEFHWGNVFPQLLEYGAPQKRLDAAAGKPCPTLLGAGVEKMGADKMMNVPALTEKDMEALKNGINDLAHTAGQLAELGKVATATAKLNEKMEEAGNAAGTFAASAGELTKKNEALNTVYATMVADMEHMAEETKTCHKSVGEMGQKLSAINSMYELQLNAVQAHAEAMKEQAAQIKGVSAHVDAMAKNMEVMQNVSAEVMKSQEAYEEGAKKLAGQVADLNKIYGNMLGALA